MKEIITYDSIPYIKVSTVISKLNAIIGINKVFVDDTSAPIIHTCENIISYIDSLDDFTKTE